MINPNNITKIKITNSHPSVPPEFILGKALITYSLPNVPWGSERRQSKFTVLMLIHGLSSNNCYKGLQGSSLCVLMDT